MHSGAATLLISPRKNSLRVRRNLPSSCPLYWMDFQRRRTKRWRSDPEWQIFAEGESVTPNLVWIFINPAEWIPDYHESIVVPTFVFRNLRYSRSAIPWPSDPRNTPIHWSGHEVPAEYFNTIRYLHSFPRFFKVKCGACGHKFKHAYSSGKSQMCLYIVTFNGCINKTRQSLLSSLGHLFI